MTIFVVIEEERETESTPESARVAFLLFVSQSLIVAYEFVRAYGCPHLFTFLFSCIRQNKKQIR